MLKSKVTILIIPLSIFGLLFIYSSTLKSKDLSEGIITYSIDYPEQKDKRFLYAILPKEMTYYFKENKLHSKINKGSFECSYSADCSKKELNTYMNDGGDYSSIIFGNDLVHYTPKDEKISLTKQKDTLLGLVVHKAIATNLKTGQKNEIWYTKDIKLRNPNWFNKYKEVPGVMIKYTMMKNGVPMVFQAKKIVRCEVSDSIFQIRKNSTRIGYSDYLAKINKLFESFQ